MKRTIPEQVIVTCDTCKRENPRRVQEGRLELKFSVVDYHGDPCANGDTAFDLCDECLHELSHLINSFVKDRTSTTEGGR